MRDELSYREYPVPAALQGSVQGLWRLAGTCSAATPHAVLPDGCISLVLNFGAPMAPALPDGVGVFERRHRLLGEVRRPLRVVAEGAIDLVGVRLVPGTSLPLSRVPLAELVDQVADADVLAQPFSALLGSLDAAEPGDRMAMLGAGLQRLARPGEPPALVQAAVDGIFRAQGNLKVEALATRLGTSRRSLERLFQAQLGFSPKSLCDVLRFQSALRLAQGSDGSNWADIACAAGYFDQSHLIRDFRRFAGETPTGLAAA